MWATHANKIERIFYRMAIKPSMTYEEEYWTIKSQHMHEMDVIEMRILRWMCDKTSKVKIRNECFRKDLQVASIGDKIKKNSFEMVWACTNNAS